MNAQELISTVQALVGGGKGLLAMDESNPTCNKRFARLGIPQTEEARRAYREALYHRARCNRAARRGQYNAAMERELKPPFPLPISRSPGQAPEGE